MLLSRDDPRLQIERTIKLGVVTRLVQFLGEDFPLLQVLIISYISLVLAMTLNL